MLMSHKLDLELYNLEIECNPKKFKKKQKGTSLVQIKDVEKIRVGIEELVIEEVSMAKEHN